MRSATEYAGTAQPGDVHLVGSIPLADADAVFRAVTEHLGDRVRRLPDGETGERSYWIHWQHGVFATHEQLAERPIPEDAGPKPPFPRYEIGNGVEPGGITFGELGYAAAALASFDRFAHLKSEGAIPAHTRFQVSLPTPAAPVEVFVHPPDRAVVEPAYERALLAELATICDGIPHQDLAIQWDVAIEFAQLEGVIDAYFDDVLGGVLERVCRVSRAVPEDVELGHHLCYGDLGHRHFVEPTDAGNLVTVANGIHADVERPLQWLHLPVPRERDDHDYFRPLADLRLHAETQLYLGLIHLTDGAEGTRRRIRAARTAVDDFGLATECGFGRRPADTVEELLSLHRELSGP